MKALAPVSLSMMLFASVGCQERGPVRQWQPTDHVGYQPPSVSPTPEAPAAPAAPADPMVAVGALFRVQCAGCHGQHGHGDGPAKPPGAQMPNFGDVAWQGSRTDEALAESILRGRGMMPSFGSQLSPEVIARLVIFVRGQAHAQ